MDKETTESGSDCRHFFLGLDIGSVSLNTVVMDEDLNIIEDFYDYVQGRPFNVLRNQTQFSSPEPSGRIPEGHSGYRFRR